MTNPTRIIAVLCLSAGGLGAATVGHAEVTATDLETIRGRYLEWVLAGPDTDYTNRHVSQRYELLKRQARRTGKKAREDIAFGQPAALYDTRKAGADQQEVSFLITQVLPHLAVAYKLPGPASDSNPFYYDPEILKLLIDSFDRLHKRGFRQGMLMPWKPQEVEQAEPETAVIVDFHLRTAGYALATLLMRHELAASGRLERTLQTCRDVISHGEKTGDLLADKLNADGVRIAVNFTLPCALAAGDTAGLQLLTRQIDRSMAVESDASDTIKPDGLGFHHRGVYLAGYASYTISQAAFVAWLFDQTGVACQPQTVANLSKSMAVLRIVSQKYDMHKALAGRLRSAAVIPHVMMGYSYLAAIDHPKCNAMKSMLARLADESFMASPLASHAFAPQRNEIPPGPGAINAFLHTLEASRQMGAEPNPNGHWAFNYGPLSVHRRDNWMVSVKGHSRYLWAFERSLTDARNDERRENVLGFHDGSASIRIHVNGEPVNAADSGYTRDGWDWCRIPGATTRLIPASELLAIDRQAKGRRMNRPFADSSFAGGVSLNGRHGVFAMQYNEVAPDRRENSLQAMKTMFFFDDQIVVVTHAIQNDDGKFPVATTLYQASLPDAETPTWIQGDKVTASEETKRFDNRKALELVDPAGNGYYVPRANNVVVRRSRRESLGYSAAAATAGNFATAWFDHGVSPAGESCEYVILVDTDPQRLARFSQEARDIYSIVQRNSRGVIVSHHRLGLTGYVLPRADVEIEKGLIVRVSAPCLAMTEKLANGDLRMSVCNPDLGWGSGKQYDYRKSDGDRPLFRPVPMPVSLTLRGRWEFVTADPEVTLKSTDANTTLVNVAASDARSIEFKLRRIP